MHRKASFFRLIIQVEKNYRRTRLADGVQFFTNNLNIQKTKDGNSPLCCVRRPNAIRKKVTY